MGTINSRTSIRFGGRTRIATALSNRAVRAVLHGILTSADDSDDIRIARAHFWEERFRLSGAIVEHAIARGEIPHGTDQRSLLEMAASPIYVRTLFTQDEVNPEFGNRPRQIQHDLRFLDDVEPKNGRRFQLGEQLGERTAAMTSELHPTLMRTV